MIGDAFMKQRERNESRRPIAADPRVRSVAPDGSVRLKVFYKLLPRISTGSTRNGCGQHCSETGGNGFQQGGRAIWTQLESCRDTDVRVVPDGRTRVDYFFGFPKSYVSYFTGA